MLCIPSFASLPRNHPVNIGLSSHYLICKSTATEVISIVIIPYIAAFVIEQAIDVIENTASITIVPVVSWLVTISRFMCRGVLAYTWLDAVYVEYMPYYS